MSDQPENLTRYGVTWRTGHSIDDPLLTPISDGFWTPWHIADAALTEARARLLAVEQENTQLTLQIEAMKRVMEHGAFDEMTLRHYGKVALTNYELRTLQSDSASLAALRARIRAMEGYVQHRAECASRFCKECGTEGLCKVLVTQHEWTPDACTCGLTALLDPPVTPREPT